MRSAFATIFESRAPQAPSDAVVGFRDALEEASATARARRSDSDSAPVATPAATPASTPMPAVPATPATTSPVVAEPLPDTTPPPAH